MYVSRCCWHLADDGQFLQAEVKICDFGSAMDASEQVKTACEAWSCAFSEKLYILGRRIATYVIH